MMELSTQSSEFQQIWNEARRAAQIASEAQYAKLGDQGALGDQGDGCAYLAMPRSLPFAHWAATALDPVWEGDDPDNPRPERLLLGDSQFSFVCDDILSVHEAAARAARDVLCRCLQTSAITVVVSG
jgi:hypothetical protein